MTMAEHDLKVWVGYFDPIKDGIKTFEIRKNDRNYQVGDTLRLREYAPGPDEYTGRETRQLVVYMLNGDDPLGFAFGLRAGHVAMSLEPA
jgi:hypothetical protein